MAAPLLPLPALPGGRRRRVERGRLPARDELPHLRVPGHALHAAGTRLLRSRDGSGLDDGVGDLAGLRGPVPATRDQDLAQARHGRRHGAHRSRDAVGRAGPGKNFWPDLAGPFFIAGIGTAFAFIPVSIGALAGVTERDAGVAAGLVNTSQNFGAAIGVAVASSIAASYSHTLVPPRLPHRCRPHRRVPAGPVGVRTDRPRRHPRRLRPHPPHWQGPAVGSVIMDPRLPGLGRGELDHGRALPLGTMSLVTEAIKL